MIRYKKSLGQNFLIDKNILSKITEKINIKNQNIFEIGAGSGNLTEYILSKNPTSLTIIEKDHNLYNNLLKKFNHHENIKIINGDILKFDLEKKIKSNSIIFGNLPYNISTKIHTSLIKFKSWPPKYKNLVLMFQKEVADRIISDSGSSSYGRLSILTGARLKLIESFFVSKNCFYPRPKVDSKVLFFQPLYKDYVEFKNLQKLEKITNLLFANRRKMINKVFRKKFKKPEELMKKLNLKPSYRPEEIKKEIFYELIKK